MIFYQMMFNMMAKKSRHPADAGPPPRWIGLVFAVIFIGFAVILFIEWAAG